MSSVVKKVVFYEIRLPTTCGVSPYKYLYDIFKVINSKGEDEILNVSSSKTDAFTRMKYQEENYNNAIRYFEGSLLSVKNGDFPGTFKSSTATTRDLDEYADKDENVYEETHFVIDTKNKERPILALESNRTGANVSAFKLYLERFGKMQALGFEFDIFIEPIYGQKAEEFVNLMVECASLEMKIKYRNAENIREYSNDLYGFISNSYSIAKADYIYATIGYDFRIKNTQHRPITTQLINWVRNLVSINRENPGFFNNFEALEVRGRETDDGKLKLFDLIEDRTAEEVIVSKRGRTKYVESKSFFKEIRIAIRENFG